MTQQVSFFITLLLFANISFAQNSLEGMSLEDLMNVDVEVATETKQSLREAPGIVTVITAADIKRTGFRDLKEILESVPGFTFGQDVIGVISATNRGIWGQEGRILILMDGVEMNEVSYGTIQLTNHFPAEHIQKIEIIRGPGSAIYGGFAELGVINIITKEGSDLDGMEVSTSYSMTANEVSRKTTNFMWGKQIEDLKLSFKGTTTKGNASDQDYTDETGTKTSLKQNSQVNDTFLNLGLEYKGFYARYIKDHYETRNPILWGVLRTDDGTPNGPNGPIREDIPKNFLTDAYTVGYNAKMSERLNTHFYYKYKVQLPWYQPDFTNQVAYENNWRRQVTREVIGAKLHYAINYRFDITLGAENQNDVSKSLNDQNRQRTSDDVHGHNNSRIATLNNKAIFTQVQYKGKLANITIGLRQDTPDSYNSTLVPRFGITKVMNNLHVKFLHAKAFRAPVIENISLNEDIKPEITTTTEIEFGYTKSNSSFTFNVFNTAIEDIIVYSYNNTSETEHYFNYDLVSTNGYEIEYKYISNAHTLKANLSYYQVNELQEAAPFETSEDPKSIFGNPRYKIWLSDSYQVSETFFITPSIVHYKDLFARDWIDNSWKETKVDDQTIVNVFMNKKDVYVKGLEFGFGVKNLTDTKIQYAQPYIKPGDWHAGLYPGQSKEYVTRIGYSKNF